MNLPVFCRDQNRLSWLSGMLLIAALPLIVGATRGHSAHSRPASGHAATAAGAPATRLWSTLLKQCGDTYIYAGSAFDGSGMLSDVQVGHTKLIEYKGVRFASVPIRVTDAERANGLEARSRVTMRAHLYRVDGEQWQDGPDLRPRNIDDMLGQALGSANSDMFDMGTNGAMALEILKFQGRWYVRRSSVDMSGSLGHNDNVFDIEKLIALPHPTYECGTHSVVASKRDADADKSDTDASGQDSNK